MYPCVSIMSSSVPLLQLIIFLWHRIRIPLLSYSLGFLCSDFLSRLLSGRTDLSSIKHLSTKMHLEPLHNVCWHCEGSWGSFLEPQQLSSERNVYNVGLTYGSEQLSACYRWYALLRSGWVCLRLWVRLRAHLYGGLLLLCHETGRCDLGKGCEYHLLQSLNERCLMYGYAR